MAHDRQADVGAEAMEPLLACAAQVIREYDAQGDHRTGTAVDRISAEWLAEKVHDAGADPALEPFALDHIEPVACFLDIAGRRIDGLPMFDGGTTDASGITGTLGPPDSDAEIALLASTPNGEYTPAFIRALADRRHRAFVVATMGALPGLAPINAPRFARPHDRPVLMVSSVEWDWLEEQADRRSRTRLVTQAERVPATAYNVVARIAGTNPDLAPVVVMTPRSGWWNCASERGGGLVCWLEAFRAVTAIAPRRTIFFTANSGHELGHLGLGAFRERHPELQHGAHVWLHFGANIGAVGSPIVLQCATDALRDLAEGALARRGLRADEMIGPGQAPVGEARNIYESGGQYLSILGRPGPVFHHSADRWPGWVDLRQIARLAAAQGDIARQLAGAD
jgi:hypothetical protein